MSASPAADPTRFRGEEVLDPARTFVCVFDMLENYRAGAEASGAIPHVRRLADECRARGVVVAWARADHRADGLDYALALSDLDVPKHRWSALHGTCLYPTMRSRGADTLILVGGSTHVGVASTAYAARDLDLQVFVVPEGLTGLAPQRTFFAEEVFPRTARVRSTDEILAALDRFPRTAGAPA
jgi:nicotinamidase-related amidase